MVERLRKVFSSELFLKAASVAVDDNPAPNGPNGIFNRFIRFFKKEVYYTHSMLHCELVPEGVYAKVINAVVPDVLIEDLPIAFAAVAMDLLTGEEIVITKGPLRRAVAASSAIPGMLPVIEVNGRPLIDGGWADNVPVAPAIALGAHFVLAVDATLEIGGMTAYPQSAVEILMRCNEITRILLARHRKSYADALIAPDVGHMFWADFSALETCMAAGRKVFVENTRYIFRQILFRRYRTLRGAVHPGRTENGGIPFL